MSNIEKNNSRIVWLSDIHIREEYSKVNSTNTVSERLVKLFDSFFDIIKEKQKNDGQIDYVFITGDIAYSGCNGDYNAFWKFFVEPLHKHFSDLKKLNTKVNYPKVITIPGNHDVNRENLTQFSNFLNEYGSNTYVFEQQNRMFSEKKDKFRALFSNYTNFFLEKKTKKTVTGKIYKDLFELKKGITFQKYYEEERLFGYLVDNKKKLIILLLNTAWFSLGKDFNNFLIKELHKELKKRNQKPSKSPTPKDIIIKKIVLELLEKKDRVAEYGNQIIGRDEFPPSTFMPVINKRADFIVITCMHHPINWLSWGETFDYGEDGQLANEFTFNQLYEKTDILLSGHEHVPIIKNPEPIDKEGKRWHLKAGMFMEDQIKVLQGTKYFEHSRFSILDIDGDNYFFKEKRFLFKRSLQKWIQPYEKEDDKNIYPLIRKKQIINDEIKKELSKQLYTFNINDFLKNQFEEDDNYAVKQTPETNYIFYEISPPRLPKTEIRLCILPLNQKFKSEQYLLPEFSPNHFLDKLITQHENIDVKVHFIWPDFLINDSIFEEYCKPDPKTDPKIVFEKLARFSDLLFNKFRHYYFSRFEELEPSNRPIVDFQYIKNVRFINQPLPFWKLKHYIKLKY